MSEKHGVSYKLGFDSRIFLEVAEWDTYRRRKPVRYIKKTHSATCSICGEAETLANPLEHSHKIGFEIGVICLGLTPDYLDSPQNIASAHKKKCNRATELSMEAAMKQLVKSGVEQLPSYLPERVRSQFDKIAKAALNR
jgi:hypothetical protein